MANDNPFIGNSAPRRGNAFSRWCGRTVLKLLGWKLVGQLPEVKKCVFIGAPHTSNWDFILAMASMLAVGLKASYMMKKEAFFWPLGGFFKWLGGVPIDRSKKTDITGQMAEWFNNNENVWLGITPEGTRSKVERYKKGYLRIAYAADVPVFVIGVNGATKEVFLDKLWPLTGDAEVDNQAIKDYVEAKFSGIRLENV